jgi:hypothetical protein
MRKTNFDHYLEGQLRDPAFAARFKEGQAWDVALQIASLRQKAGTVPKGAGQTPQDFGAVH